MKNSIMYNKQQAELPSDTRGCAWNNRRIHRAVEGWCTGGTGGHQQSKVAISYPKQDGSQL